MRKSVKRSLLVWPLIASATLTLGSAMQSFDPSHQATRWDASSINAWMTARKSELNNWIRSDDLDLEPTVENPVNRTAGISPATAWGNTRPILGDDQAPMCTIEIVSRHQGGRRALELPSRLAQAWKIGSPFMPPVESVAPPKIELPIELPIADAKPAAGLSDNGFPSHDRFNPVLLYPQHCLAGGVGPLVTSGKLLAPIGIRSEGSQVPARPFPVGPFRVAAVHSVGPWASGQLMGSSAIESMSRPASDRPEAQPDSADLSGSDRQPVPAVQSSQTPEIQTPEIQIAKIDAPERTKRTHWNVWPSTPALDVILQGLSSFDESDSSEGAINLEDAGRWANQVDAALNALKRLERIADPQASTLIDQLETLADEGSRNAEQTLSRELQIEWLRAVHATRRRVAVWRAVHQVAASQQPAARAPRSFVGDLPVPTGIVQANGSPTAISIGPVVGDSVANDSFAGHSAADRDVTETINAIRLLLEPTGDTEGWASFLLLDDIESANRDTEPGSPDRLVISQRFLSRLHWHGLTIDAQEFLSDAQIQSLEDQMRPWAGGAVDYVKLLQQIERQESDAIDLGSVDIADAIMTLRHASDENAVNVARALTTHYRNANLRLAISEELINRFIPTVDPEIVPLRTQLLGSRVRGSSTIQSQLSVDLVPSSHRWALKLRTKGEVATRSVSRRDGVAIRTAGQSTFEAGKPIEISREGIRSGDSFVRARGTTRLRGIETKYDSWPLVGSLVQAIAGDKFAEVRPISQRISNGRIEDEVRQEMNSRVDDTVQTAGGKMSEMLLGPLGRMGLDPQVVDMQTTTDRLTARYRLAGDWQMAAFTPRPRAIRGSLMSAQVHQSAINNTLEQVIPRDSALPLEEVVTRSLGAFGQSAELPDDLPEGVRIQFASTRPITVEIADNQLWITMRVVSLSREKGKALTKFLVRAAYRPEFDGLDAKLVRNGHLRISGPGMSMGQRLPLRAIFNKVLSESRALPLTMPALTQNERAEGLVISQFELRDGWIAMAISEAEGPAPRIAAPRIAVESAPRQGY